MKRVLSLLIIMTLLASAVLIGGATPVASQQQCTEELQECPDGTGVARNPARNCEFDPCPSEIKPCQKDARVCSDGTSVGRDPYNNCKFKPCPEKSQDCLKTPALSITDVWHKRDSLVNAAEEISIRDIVNVQWMCTEMACSPNAYHCNTCQGTFFMQVREDVNIGIPLVDRSNKISCSSWDMGVDATCSGIEPGSEYLIHGSVRSDNTYPVPGFYIELSNLQKCSETPKACEQCTPQYGQCVAEAQRIAMAPGPNRDLAVQSIIADCKESYNTCIGSCKGAEPTQPKCEKGCYAAGKNGCVPVGTRLLRSEATSEESAEPMYCSVDGTFKPQKDDGETAQNSYECKGNFASDNVCVAVKEQLNFLQKIFNFFKRLFGGN